jgi:hypothetical protein
VEHYQISIKYVNWFYSWADRYDLHIKHSSIFLRCEEDLKITNFFLHNYITQLERAGVKQYISNLSQHSPGGTEISQFTSLRLADISANIKTGHFISTHLHLQTEFDIFILHIHLWQQLANFMFTALESFDEEVSPISFTLKSPVQKLVFYKNIAMCSKPVITYLKIQDSKAHTYTLYHGTGYHITLNFGLHIYWFFKKEKSMKKCYTIVKEYSLDVYIQTYTQNRYTGAQIQSS